MNDPSIEAAQRAWAELFPLGPSWSAVAHATDFFAAAPREALRPVREWCDKWLNELSIRGLDEALDELAPLIFTAEELTDD